MPIPREAIFSQDLRRTYRYTLWRTWGENDAPFVQFIGLNPSTADHLVDDPTVTRCRDYARRWNFTALCVTNLFAFRSTKPSGLKKARDPIGPDNDAHLFRVAGEAGLIVAIWGSRFNKWQVLRGRKQAVYEQVRELSCIGLTPTGNHPKHPLGHPKTAMPQIYPYR